jgi:hypothetical protein
MTLWYCDRYNWDYFYICDENIGRSLFSSLGRLQTKTKKKKKKKLKNHESLNDLLEQKWESNVLEKHKIK